MNSSIERIAQGAEAVIFLDKSKDVIIKQRIKKDYRIKEIDDKLRKFRTKREAKVMEKMPVAKPKLINVDKSSMSIEMEYIKGKKIRDLMNKDNFRSFAKEIGQKIGAMHKNGIIHGDLTTSNMIFSDNKKEIFFIDFGLSFFSQKIEDKAVDLHLLKRALESKHYSIWEECFNIVLKSYSDKDVIKRLDKVELRGRNKAK